MGRSETASACASDEQLRRLHAKELADADATPLTQHLERCAACRDRSQRLLAAHETWIARLRAAGAPPTADNAARHGAAPLGDREIAGYEIREELHRGGQGLVYRALQQSTRREVAIKVLREGPYASERARRRFEREVELVAQLDHPGIVKVFDSGQTGAGRQFLVMDLVRGARLDEHLKRRQPPLTERLRLFALICDAVNYAHLHGVIHRDLKPANVLVDEHDRPRVLDFGLARALNEQDATRVTADETITGTLAYMAPEQARGLGDAIDVRTDVYALGVMLYELLTGGFPYPVAGDAIRVLRHIAETEPDAMRSTQPGQTIAADLETITRKALRKTPADRYQTASELGRDVERFLVGEPIAARRDNQLYLLRKRLQRSRGIIATSVLIGTVLTVSVALLAVSLQRQHRLRDEAEQARNRAEHRLTQVREIANAFLIDIDPLIRQLPGAAPAREAIVTKGLGYLDALTEEAQDSDDLRLDLARGYLIIGDVQGDLNSSTLATPEAALTSYGRAETLLRPLAARSSAALDVTRDLALCLQKQALALNTLGRTAERDTAQHEALELLTALVAAHPENRRLLRDLSVLYERLGNQTGNLDQKLEHYDRAMALAERIVDASSDDLWSLRDLFVGYTKQANVHMGRGELDQALENWRKFRSFAERLSAAYPDNLVARRDLSTAYQWLGIIQSAKGATDSAVGHFRDAIAINQAVLRQEPNSARALNDQTTVYVKLVEALLAAERVDEAADAIDACIGAAERLVAAHETIPSYQRVLAVAYYKRAEWNRARGQDEELSASQRTNHWREVRIALDRARGRFEQMLAGGTLAESDGAVIDELTAEIEACDDAIAALEPDTPSQ